MRDADITKSRDVNGTYILRCVVGLIGQDIR